MKLEPSFAALAARYRVIFFDAYGVLKNSGGMIEGVPRVITSLRRQGKIPFVVTNDASRSPESMAAFYVDPETGESLFSPDDIVSSGFLAQNYLAAKVRTGKAAYVGTPASAYYIRTAGLDAVPLHDAQADDPSIGALVFLDDEGFDWSRELNLAVNFLRHRSLPVIVANADRAYPVRGDHVAVVVGSLARLVEGIVGREFYHFGKPGTQIFSMSLYLARQVLPDLRKDEILMVGDTLTTDIQGADKFGLDTVLVLSGNTQAEEAEYLVHSTGIRPDFLCRSIAT